MILQKVPRENVQRLIAEEDLSLKSNLPNRRWHHRALLNKNFHSKHTSTDLDLIEPKQARDSMLKNLLKKIKRVYLTLTVVLSQQIGLQVAICRIEISIQRIRT